MLVVQVFVDQLLGLYFYLDDYLNHPLTNVQGTAGQFAEFSSIIYRAILK